MSLATSKRAEREARDEELTRSRAEARLLREAMQRITRLCGRIAVGDLEARLPADSSDPDVAQAALGLNRLLDVTDAFVREAKAALSHASHGKFFRRVLLKGMPGTFRQAAQVINDASHAMELSAGALAEAEERRIGLAREFEKSIQSSVAALAASATEMRATAESLAVAANGTRERAIAVARAAESTSESVRVVASATQQMSASAAEIGRQMDSSTRTMGETVADSKRVIGGLSEASLQIGHVVKLISEIARRTNLLALNATIEAARAGEVGKGFAVVASEVKSLARQTSEATDQIEGRITAIQDAARDGVSAIGSVGDAIGNVDGAFAGIAAAIDEQRRSASEITSNVTVAARGTEEVSSAIRRVSDTAEETDQAVGALLHTAAELSRQAEALLVSTTSFVAVVRGAAPREAA